MQLVILLWWARPELRPVPKNDSDVATLTTLGRCLDSIQSIARVERGFRADLFFKREQLYYAVDKVHQTLLDGLDSPSTLLLYEPCVSKDEIETCGITDGRVWATVSPLEERYKEFSKYSSMKYMECPYEDELVFMAAVMENGVEPELKPLYEASLVRERIRTRGPFLRVVLPESADDLNADDMAEGSELAELTLKKLQKAWFITEERIVGMMKISDRILRISPVLDGVFNSYTLKPANDRVVERLGNLMFDVDVRELKRQLIAYIANPDDRWVSPAVKESMPITLETFFVKYAAAHDIERRWEGWEVATAKFSANSNDDPNWVTQWEAFSLNVNHINRAKKPTYADFVAAPTSIFYMNDPGYPFMDCFWYDDDMKAVHAGQVTMSQDGHPKGVGTFNTMKNIGIPDGAKMVVNYITLSSQAGRYANGPRSYFFSDVHDGGVTAIQQTVEFRVVKMSLR
ncbi:hypothetical protein B5M09_011340 [Aphanomyces astaci]|uniref:Uncharacterized protein n=1 Tax=Aphanomyces astaci TaxID=112090 RepID=A0A3R7XPD6_APHAT|nr:hypothetical protein B5M09_011340 [Aphanomyces astaci]